MTLRTVSWAPLGSVFAIACGSASSEHAQTASRASKLDASSYCPSDAVAYADTHWDNGVGECAAFVSAAVNAGGTSMTLTWVPDMVDALRGVDYDEYDSSHTTVGGQPGDIVVYSDASGSDFCLSNSGPHNCGHVGIVVVGGGSIASIKADFHNNAHYHLALSGILGGSYSTLRVYHLSSYGSCGGGGAPPQPSQQQPAPQCTLDSDCNGGASGSQIICSNAGTCVSGCHGAGDCPASYTCDTSTATWSCTFSGCTNDSDCNAGAAGSGLVCAGSGSDKGLCINGCHSDFDCTYGYTCTHTSPHWTCQ